MSKAGVLTDRSPSAALPAGFGELFDAVNALDGNTSDAALIDQIGALERLKSACAAAQARLTHTFTLSQTADGAARRRDPDTTRRSIAAQIALARRQSVTDLELASVDLREQATAAADVDQAGVEPVDPHLSPVDVWTS